MPKSSKSQEARRNLNLGPKVSRMTPLYKEIEQETKPFQNAHFCEISCVRQGGQFRAGVKSYKCHFIGSKAWWSVFVGNQNSQNLNFLGAPSRRASVCNPRSLRMVARRRWTLWRLKLLLPKWLGMVVGGFSGTLETFRHFGYSNFFLGRIFVFVTLLSQYLGNFCFHDCTQKLTCTNLVHPRCRRIYIFQVGRFRKWSFWFGLWLFCWSISVFDAQNGTCASPMDIFPKPLVDAKIIQKPGSQESESGPKS